MVLAEMSRLCRLVRSENISGWRDEIWFSDRFNTIRLPSPLKDFLERQESQSACKELADKSISTSLVRGWKSRDERTDSLLFSSLSWLSSGTLSKRLAGRATISLPDSESWLSVVITPLQVRGVYFNIYNYPRDPEFWGHRGRWELHHGPGRSDCCWVGAAWGWRRSWRRPLPPAWDRWRRGPVWRETSVCSCLPCQSRGRWRPWGCCVTCWERSSSALNTVHRLAVATLRCGRARDCWGEAALNMSQVTSWHSRQSALPARLPSSTDRDTGCSGWGKVWTVRLSSLCRPARLPVGRWESLQYLMVRSCSPCRWWKLPLCSRDLWLTSSAQWMERDTVPWEGITEKFVWSNSEFIVLKNQECKIYHI